MKLVLIIICQFLFNNSLAQKLDKANLDDFAINDFQFIFPVKNISDFEKNTGKILFKKVDEYEKVPFINKTPSKMFRNANILLYIKKDKVYWSQK